MSLTVAQCKTELQSHLLSRIDEKRMKFVTNTYLLRVLNLVARNLNEAAEIRVERYKRDTVDGTTNYELQRDMLIPYRFIYKGDGYQTMNWTCVQVAGTPFVSKIIFESDPGENEMDLWYLGQTTDVTDDTDEIDLPDQVLEDFLDLVKVKIECDHGDLSILDRRTVYRTALEETADRVKQGLPDYNIMGGSVSSWMDHDYDITDNWVGTENVVLSGSTYVWIT